MVQQDMNTWKDAVDTFDKALELLEDDAIEENDEKAHVAGWAEMARANVLVNTSAAEGIKEGIQGYQRALKRFESIENPSPSQKADIAAAWGNIGHAQSRISAKQTLEQAEGCFRQAITILEELPWKDHTRYRHHLAATWLNLGNLLARFGKPNRPERRTVEAFEMALQIMGDLPQEDLAVGILLANTHASLGRAIMWSEEKSNLDLAVASFEEAIRIIANIKDKEDPRLILEMASAHANRANLLSRAPATKESIQETLSSGEYALKMAQSSEKANLMAAEISLSARRSICHAFGMLVGNQSPEVQQEMHGNASDLLEDGLKLVKLWEDRNAVGLRKSAQHLFHLGCAFYCTQQPHFLPEFINENLDSEKPDPVMLESAQRTVKEAISRIENADPTESEVTTALKQLLEKLKPNE